MKPRRFALFSVKATPTASLLLRCADGEPSEVSLADTIKQHPALKRLKDPKVFSSAKVGDHGASVIWPNDDELELAADNLRACAVEQAASVSHEFIWNRMTRNDLTRDTAVVALGVSRRMLACCRSGSKPVPRTVAPACLGWEEVIKNDGGYALAAQVRPAIAAGLRDRPVRSHPAAGIRQRQQLADGGCSGRRSRRHFADVQDEI